MPKYALPLRLQDPKNWRGSDWDNPWQRWLIPFKGWFAFGPRAKEAWARWREYPITVFAVFGKGQMRFESTDGKYEYIMQTNPIWMFNPERLQYSKWYLSRVQYYCRWHIALQWPLSLQFHFYINKDKIPVSPQRPGTLTIKDLIFGYGPIHRDADLVYWILSFFFGGEWK